MGEHERALQLDPKLVQAHVNLIILHGRIRNLTKAQEHYQAAVKLNPNQFPGAYYNYGVLLTQQGKLDEAERAFHRALEINPAYADAHNNLGTLLQRQGKISEAAEEFRKALASQPNFRQAHFNLGRILVNQGNYQGGIEEFQKTLSPVDEKTPSYLYALGATYGRAGDRQNALRYLQQAREQALASGQTGLMASIDQDLRGLRAQQDQTSWILPSKVYSNVF
jgi:tetratricopeptide (TPR) repeat protein